MDIANLHDVEDYSSEPSSPHDQLPSVEEAISNMGGVSPKKASSSPRKRFLMLVLGVAAAVTLLIVVIAIPVGSNKKGSPYVQDIDSALNTIALHGSSDFDDTSSYQYAAKAYLDDPFVIGSYTQKQLQQRYAMYCLYHATTPNSWVKNSGWKRKGKPECEWDGVSCDDTNTWVHRIEVESNGLLGTIPEEIVLIPDLAVFNVNANSGLTGEIPEAICDIHTVKADCSVVQCSCCENCS